MTQINGNEHQMDSADSLYSKVLFILNSRSQHNKESYSCECKPMKARGMDYKKRNAFQLSKRRYSSESWKIFGWGNEVRGSLQYRCQHGTGVRDSSHSSGGWLGICSSTELNQSTESGGYVQMRKQECLEKEMTKGPSKTNTYLTWWIKLNQHISQQSHLTAGLHLAHASKLACAEKILFCSYWHKYP